MRDKVVGVACMCVVTLECLPLHMQWLIRKESINSAARIYRQLMSSSFSSGGILSSM